MTRSRKKAPKRRPILWLGIPGLAAVLLFCWIWPKGVFPGGGSAMAAPAFPHASLVIERADGRKIPLAVEVATTPRQEEYGLMFRHSLPSNAGMLFVFRPDQVVNMWMKNTYIPLDMLFVRADGTIAKIVTHAEPMNLTNISSGEPVKGVIEINDGAAASHGLKTGDKIIYPGFGG